MFDEKTILARLQNGEDAQTIADEMAAMINAANKTYTDQKAAEEAAKKQNELQKEEDLQEILDMLYDWFDIYYGMDVKEIRSELKADQVIELIDSLKEYFKALKDLETMFDMKNAPKIIKSNTKPKSADDKISDFLNKMGW